MARVATRARLDCGAAPARGSAGRLIDVRRVVGDIKGDESTYIAMALSLANDGDLRYEPADYRRFVSLYGHGPSGIFLKTRYHLGLTGKTPVPPGESLAYGKALAYPVAAAPFVLVGGLGGLLVFNYVLLGVCLVCGARFCRAVTRSRAGWVAAVIFIGASVVPVYAAWFTSEMFNFALVFVAYFLWAYQKIAAEGEQTWLLHPRTTIIAAVQSGWQRFRRQRMPPSSPRSCLTRSCPCGCDGRWPWPSCS